MAFRTIQKMAQFFCSQCITLVVKSKHYIYDWKVQQWYSSTHSLGIWVRRKVYEIGDEERKTNPIKLWVFFLKYLKTQMPIVIFQNSDESHKSMSCHWAKVSKEHCRIQTDGWVGGCLLPSLFACKVFFSNVPFSSHFTSTDYSEDR